MARKTKYDLDSFRKLLLTGKSKAEIMKEMGIKNHPTFNNLMLKLMDTDNKYYKVKTTRRRRTAKPVIAKIGRRNTLALSAKILESSNFQPGDSFAVKLTKNKITLNLLDK